MSPCLVARLTRRPLAGIGFAKDKGQNLLLLKRLGDLRRALHHVPLLVGLSRKRFIGTVSRWKDTFEGGGGVLGPPLHFPRLPGGRVKRSSV
jgi:hypothetical protein